jgi:hypothetical protein
MFVYKHVKGLFSQHSDEAVGWIRFLVGERNSFLLNVQTSSGTHPASYGLGTRSVKLTTHLHLVLRLGMVDLYLHYPKHLHGTVLNYFSQG